MNSHLKVPSIMIVLLTLALTNGLLTGISRPIPTQRAQAINGNEATQTPDSEVDLSGEWFDQNAKKWNISQKGSEVVLVQEVNKLRYQGILKDRIIKYTSYITLRTTKQKECNDFIGSRIEFEVQLILSKDWNKMEMKAPDSVSKGGCKISLKSIPPLTLSRGNVK